MGEATAKAVRIVLARRTAPDNRVWANVEELARELVAEYGMEVEVVSFGAITFREQVSLDLSWSTLSLPWPVG